MKLRKEEGHRKKEHNRRHIHHIYANRTYQIFESRVEMLTIMNQTMKGLDKQWCM